MKHEIAHACRNGCRSHRGPDSFWMQDPDLLFDRLNLSKGDTFADLGCGSGSYALAAAQIVGSRGHIYALDRNESGIHALAEEARMNGSDQVKGVVADLTGKIPLGDGLCDVCFICTVLHALDLPRCADGLFREIFRILKPSGRFFVVECRKEQTAFGPPLARRISVEQLDDLVESAGFQRFDLTDMGHNYLAEYRKG